MSDHPSRPLSRRGLLLGTGAGALAGLASGTGLGFARGRTHGSSDGIPSDGSRHTAPSSGQDSNGVPVPASGTTQAGVARPETPQPHALVAVGDVDLDAVFESLAQLGALILALTGGGKPSTAAASAETASSETALLPDGPGDLTVLVGVGPRVLSQATAHPGLAEALDMPAYAGDETLPAHALGGDLMLSVNSSNPVDLEPVLAALIGAVAGFEPRWSRLGFRGPGEGGVSRNPLGYHDGVIVPRGDEELAESVWIDAGPLAGGTICVMRGFILDVRGFKQLTASEQDAVIGRERASGSPLSGGNLHDEALLNAKTPAGDFLVPAGAHLRAAHPSFTGSKLMARRSYSFVADGERGLEQGLLFTAFQNDISTFVRTQLRLDEVDSLMAFTRVTATAAFCVLPGFSADRPLGTTLRT